MAWTEGAVVGATVGAVEGAMEGMVALEVQASEIVSCTAAMHPNGGVVLQRAMAMALPEVLTKETEPMAPPVGGHQMEDAVRPRTTRERMARGVTKTMTTRKLSNELDWLLCISTGRPFHERCPWVATTPRSQGAPKSSRSGTSTLTEA